MAHDYPRLNIKAVTSGQQVAATKEADMEDDDDDNFLSVVSADDEDLPNSSFEVEVM